MEIGIRTQSTRLGTLPLATMKPLSKRVFCLRSQSDDLAYKALQLTPWIAVACPSPRCDERTEPHRARKARVGWGKERTPTLQRARYVGVPSSPQPELLIAVRSYGRRRYFMVVYRQVSADDGFIITAYS